MQTETLLSILKDDMINSVEGNLINCLVESDSSKFYQELFSESELSDRPELFNQNKEEMNAKFAPHERMEQLVRFMETNLSEEDITLEIGGGVYQHRAADAYKRLPNYFPLDISVSSISRYCDKYKKAGVVADATHLPLKDESVNCIFTHTFLEHPIEPEYVLEEIIRVLKPGGIVVHNDAWFCRWWQRYGIIGLKTFSSMTLQEKLISILYRITDIKLFRAAIIMLQRVFRILILGSKGPQRLRFTRLRPNYTLHLGADEDAASSLDPMEVVRFYESRGFKLEPPLKMSKRFFFMNRPIIMIKK
jgi:ubiquinone/menaquinone biosynthesis C-methylase UbiE